MEYTFKKTNYCADDVPAHLVNYDFGVTVQDEKIKSLEQIESGIWTPEYIDQLIAEINAIEGDAEMQFEAEGSHLFMLIDKDDVLFFNSLSKKREADFTWTTSKFLNFLNEFKKFIEENS